MLHGQLSGKILNAFYTVYNGLGHGFLEKVYENALMLELRKRGMEPLQQSRVEVWYEGARVGDYFADIIVKGPIILELKTAEAIAPEHEAQLINYLNATDV